MANKTASVIFFIVLISLTCAQLDKKTTTEIPPSSSTTEIPETTSTSTTEIHTTTTASTTTAPPTTTAAPTTTTTATTTAQTTTSTVAPSTTTVAPSPTPVPPPEFKKWSYTDKNDSTCVIVQLAVQLNLTYAKSDNSLANVLYNVPIDKANLANGSCGTDDQSISLKWGQVSSIMLQFTANTTAQQFALSEIVLSINASDVLPDAKANQILELNHISNDFPTSFSKSYHCNRIETINFTNTKEGKDIVATAAISHVQFEAFHKQKNDQFSTARDCEDIDTPDIVPIAVGCALAGLVVVVLIAYLVGRRRAQASGYLSM